MKHNKQNSNVTLAPAPVSAPASIVESRAPAHEPTLTHDRSVSTLESLCAFEGSTLELMPEMSISESIRLGVSLVNRGEETKERGIYVLANKAYELDAEALTAFKVSLKSEIVNEAKAKAVALLGSDADEVTLKKAKDAAEEAAKKRFDNIGQTMRAALWALSNPDKVADKMSVFAIQQANAYLDEPETGKAGAEEKKAIRAEILPLLKAGATQPEVNKAIKAAKAKLEEAKTPVDNRSDSQKNADAQTALIARIPERLALLVKDIDGLAGAGVKPEEWRSEKLSAAAKALCALAGVEVKE